MIRKRSTYEQIGKRLLDVLISSISIIVMLPLLVLVFLLIVIDTPGNGFFIQERLGKNLVAFKIIKFRTMYNDRISQEEKLRITPVGKILRRTSLDELPQLINILVGHMSFVGPRPILASEFKEANIEISCLERFSVLPGLYCTVDIDKRSKASREEQLLLDVEYVNNISFINDLRISLLTFINVIRMRNTSKR